ncbi:MAG: hypothetical protein GX362_02395 [Methanosarcinaceae archaeon]|nr:hypothetical protein [Methanosarcinaceae archaeon]
MTLPLDTSACIINRNRAQEVWNALGYMSSCSMSTNYYKKIYEEGYNKLHELKEYYLIA